YGHEILVRKTESTNVGSGEAERLGSRDHQRSALQPLRFLLFLEAANEFVGYDAARHLSCLHHLCNLGRGKINIGEDRSLAQSLARQVMLQFAEFTDVV